MSCERYREIASAHLDGEATPDEIAALEEHQVDCAECRTWVAEATANRGRLLDWPEERPRQRIRGPLRPSVWRGWAAAAVVAVIALTLGFTAGRVSSSLVTVDTRSEVPRRKGFVEQRRTVYPARNETYSEVVLDSAGPSN